MTPDKARERLAEINAILDAADEWGAHIGALHEERKGLLRAMGAKSFLASFRWPQDGGLIVMELTVSVPDRQILEVEIRDGDDRKTIRLHKALKNQKQENDPC